jgi:hypothetical protein
MGAWGYEMRENDSGLDALGTITDYDYDAPQPYILKEALRPWDEIFAEFDDIQVLAVSEWLLENGHTGLPLARVHEAIKNELSYQELKRWDDPEARIAALKAFQEKLPGPEAIWSYSQRTFVEEPE